MVNSIIVIENLLKLKTGLVLRLTLNRDGGIFKLIHAAVYFKIFLGMSHTKCSKVMQECCFFFGMGCPSHVKRE